MLRYANYRHWYWFKLPEGSLEHAVLTMSRPALNRPWVPLSACRSLCLLSAPCCFSPPCFTHAHPPAQIALLLLLHLANSSFKTPLRGQLQEAFPAPPRLGKMLPVCSSSWNLAHVLCHLLICVCVSPPPLDYAPPGQRPCPSAHLCSPSSQPIVFHR